MGPWRIKEIMELNDKQNERRKKQQGKKEKEKGKRGEWCPAGETP